MKFFRISTLENSLPPSHQIKKFLVSIVSWKQVSSKSSDQNDLCIFSLENIFLPRHHLRKNSVSFLLNISFSKSSDEDIFGISSLENKPLPSHQISTFWVYFSWNKLLPSHQISTFWVHLSWNKLLPNHQFVADFVSILWKIRIIRIIGS